MATLLIGVVGCGEVARPGPAAPSPTEALVTSVDPVPGEIGQPLDPLTPALDVSFEAHTNEVSDQLTAVLTDPAFIDWEAARTLFQEPGDAVDGAIPPTLSAISAGIATGPLGAAYIQHFGSADWLQQRALASLNGDGQFATQTGPERATALANVVTIELPLVRALVAVEAGARLAEEGDANPWFGAPHEWVRLWVILQGAERLDDALTEETLDAIRAGADAAAAGDPQGARDAHDVIRGSLVRTALEAIGQPDSARAAAYLNAVEPLLMRLDRDATERLRAHLEAEAPLDTVAIQGLVAQLADRAGVEPLFVLAAPPTEGEAAPRSARPVA